MLRFFIRFFAFVLLLVANLSVVELYVQLRYMSDEDMKFAAAMKGDTVYDAVVLGTSTSSLAVNPLLLERENFNLYNMAIAGAGPAYFSRWYPIFRRHHPPPKLVLWGVDWFSFDRGYLRRQLEHDSGRLPLTDALGLLADPQSSQRELLLNRFALVTKRKALLDPAEARRLTEQTFYKGNLTFPPFGHMLPAPVPRQPADPAAVAEVERLIRAMQAEGTRVVLFQPPHHLPTMGEQAEARARVAAMAARLGVRWLDYDGDRRSAINHDASAFNDWAHLNEFGTWRFSRLLRADLEAEGLLPRRKL